MKKAPYNSLVKVTRVQELPPANFTVGEQMVANYWKENIATKAEFDGDKEHLYVFILDTKYNVIGMSLVSMGSLNESIAHPREIFRPAIAMGAYAIILAHNHPSGVTDPSTADRHTTRRITEAGELLQIKLLDHVIVSSGGENPYSFRAAGLV